MSYLITGSDGYLAAQHHGPTDGGNYDPDVRLTFRMIRVFGRDPDDATKMPPMGTMYSVS